MTTTMAAVPRTLLSCPFCGGTRIFTEPDERGSGGQWVTPIHVGCNDCKAEQMADTVDEAVERWNRRSAAPGVSTVEDAVDDSIALDRLADYIADTWPDKKYGLEEICQRLHAMWPGEFLSAADLEKNDPNVREALRALLLWWDRFQASDGDPKDACELLVKGARSAWQFAEVEIDRVPVPAPAAGDAIRDLIAKHAELLDKSDHTYFELARTRQTGWMAWLCSHPAETHPDRKVLARGQGETPDEACREALADFEMRAALSAPQAEQGERDAK